MYQISEACKAALTGDHTQEVVAEVFQGFGRLLASTYSTPRIELDSTGEIKVEKGAKHSRSFSAKVLDPEGLLVPEDDMGWLDPLTRPQLQFYFDIGWEDDFGGHVERIPTGRFTLDRNQVEETGGEGAIMSITGNSRSSTSIQDNAWLQPYQMRNGVNWDYAILLALQDRRLDGWVQQFRFESSVTNMPLGVQLVPTEGSDPWADLQAMAVSDAKELLEDALGAFLLRTPADVTTLTDKDAVCQYVEAIGSASHEIGTTRDIDISKALNGAIVRGNAPWLLSPVIGVAWDDDSGSPTYYKGKFGRRAQTFDDSTVGDETQANAVARQKLAKILGVSEQVDFQTLPNPAHEPGDVIKVVFSGSKVDALVVLQSFTLPFDVGATMPVTINRVRK